MSVSDFYDTNYKRKDVEDGESSFKRKRFDKPFVNNYPASKRKQDNKSAIRCKYCPSQHITMKQFTIVKMVPFITMKCNKCDKYFDLRLYEDDGNVIIDRIETEN